jgi:hypothetical protein
MRIVGAPDRRADAYVMEFGGWHRQAGFDVSQALALGQLGKRQNAKVFGTRKRADTVIITITRDDAAERCPRQKIHQLRKQGLSGVYEEYSLDNLLKETSRSSRHHPFLSKNDFES